MSPALDKKGYSRSRKGESRKSNIETPIAEPTTIVSIDSNPPRATQQVVAHSALLNYTNALSAQGKSEASKSRMS